MYMYSLMYMLVFDGKLISFTFSASSLDDLKAKQLFDKYEMLFYLLAGKTIIISQWKWLEHFLDTV